MGATAAIVTMFGAGMSAYGQVQAGRAHEALANRQAQVAEQQAQDAIARGQVAEERRRLQTRQQIGAQRAAYASQGVDVNVGTPVDTQTDTASIGELDAQMIRRNAQLEAWGYRTGAADVRARGDIAAEEGKMGAFQTILGGASRAYGYKSGAYNKIKD